MDSVITPRSWLPPLWPWGGGGNIVAAFTRVEMIIIQLYMSELLEIPDHSVV